MGASQGKNKDKKKASAEDGDVTIDPQSSAVLGKRLVQNKVKGKGGQIMPWNDDNDDEMNDREGAVDRAASLQQPQNQPGHPSSARVMNQDSFEDLERQIEQIERQRLQEGQNTNRQNVSLNEEVQEEGAQNEGQPPAADQVGDEEMFNAIVASLIDYTGNDNNEANQKVEDDQERQLKEVLALSKLENDKNTGQLNLDFLKRKKQTTQKEAKESAPVVASLQPAPIQQQKTTYMLPAPTATAANSNLPPPAMVTAVVNLAPIPESNKSNQHRILPEPSLAPMVTKLQLGSIEELKSSNNVLAAPKSLAPITSKSKASLPLLSMPQSTKNVHASNNPFESKLSQIPNAASEHDTEYDQSSKTIMPREGQHLDEIEAMMGHGGSMAELQTSMYTRSPGPTNRSKLNMGMDTSSIIPAESNYAAHQQSVRDDETSMLEGLMIGSPEGPRTGARNQDRQNQNHSLTMKAHPIKENYDEYEDLLNTIEQEHSTIKPQAAQGSMMQVKRNDSDLPAGSTLTKDETVSHMNHKTMNLHEDEPIIDFQLEQEISVMEDMAETESKKKGKEVPLKLKKNLNESSDFDLDDY